MREKESLSNIKGERMERKRETKETKINERSKGKSCYWRVVYGVVGEPS